MGGSQSSWRCRGAACGQYICPSILHTQQELQGQWQRQTLTTTAAAAPATVAGGTRAMKTHKRLSEAATEPVDKQTRTRPKGWQKVLPTTLHASMGCSSCVATVARCPLLLLLMLLRLLLLSSFCCCMATAHYHFVVFHAFILIVPSGSRQQKILLPLSLTPSVASASISAPLPAPAACKRGDIGIGLTDK